SFSELFDAWLDAEESSREGFWFPPDYHPFSYDRDGCCLSCNAAAAACLKSETHFGVRQAIRTPEWFVARSAVLAVELVRGGPNGNNRGDAELAERRVQFDLYLDVVGDPFAPASAAPATLRQNPAVARLVRVIEAESACDALTGHALADALEEAGHRGGEALA